MGGLSSTVINPRVIFVQATEPSDKTEGKLWYNTSENALYTSNGTSYVLTETSVDYIVEAVSQNRLNILVNSVASSSTLNDYDDGFADAMSDSDGKNDTINTGNTTASYDATNDYYQNSVSNSEAHGLTLDLTGTGRTQKNGVKITCGSTAVDVVSITKHSSDPSTKGYVLDSSKSVVATGDFSGDTCTFATPYSLTASTVYYLATDQNGASFGPRYKSNGLSSPIAGTYFEWTYGMDSEVDSEHAMSVLSAVVQTDPANKIVETNAQSVTTGATHCMLVATNSTAGSGSVTYDISMDNGATETTGLALNTKNSITSTTGTQCILTINLNGTGDGNTANVSDYALFLYY